MGTLAGTGTRAGPRRAAARTSLLFNEQSGGLALAEAHRRVHRERLNLPDLYESPSPLHAKACGQTNSNKQSSVIKLTAKSKGFI
jgi:hypothetical protein